MAFEDRYNRAQFPFTQGVPVTFNLNTGSNILSGCVIVNATVTITGAGAVGTPIGEGGPVNLVRRIRVLANKAAGSRYPNGALVNCSPRSLLRFAMTQRKGKFVAEQSGSTLGNGANGVYDIYLSIPIYFADSMNQNGVQTALNMNLQDSQGNPIYSAVQVQVELADLITELFSGNTGAMTVAGMVEWKDDRLQLQKDSIPLVQEDHYLPILTANERLVDQQMPNDGAFTQWLILGEQGQPGLALSDALLNRLEIQGASLNFKEHWQDTRQAMIDSGFYDPSQNLTGQFFLDWTHGVLQNSNAAAGLQHYLSVNNPSGAGLDRFRIYTRRVYGLA